MSTVGLTMAQALVRYLDAQYVEIDGEERKFVTGVMGIFGHGNVTGIGEALERGRGSLDFIQGKSEQGMAHAAAAYAKQSGRLAIYACTSSIGPGALNMVTAAATATVNRIPLLLLPGDIFADRQPDPVLQQLEHPMDYTVSANDAFKPVSRYWDRITRPEQLMSAMAQAMRVLTDPADTGAVTIALPQDVQAEAYDYPEAFFRKRVHSIDRRPPSSSALARAAKLIADKKRPVIVAGGGVHYALATETLRKFAEQFGIPVTETQAGKSVLPWNHPLNLGAVGVTGTLAANRTAAEADLVIAVGTRLSDFTTASKTAFANPEAELLCVNVAAFDAHKLDGTALVADAKLALEGLAGLLTQQGYRADYDSAALSARKAEWNAEVDALYALEREDGLTQTRALGVINEFIGEDDVIVCAAGSLPGDLHRLWRPGKPQTYHMEYGFSCMGYEISGAFGAKLARTEGEVYALVGDGSFLMLHSELVTSLQERRKINVLLFDNHGFQCIHNLQRGHGSDGFGNEFRYKEAGVLGGDPLPIDFRALAASLGCAAFAAHDADSLRAALEQAAASDRSTLVHMQVLPGTNTDGYESWWRVDGAAVSVSPKVTAAHEANAKIRGQARPI
ncbi:3D-(3,5/4)-trihydroxycyclohexane-1,2-dione acylhydrolase (decyclizing) [Paenibacillus sp. MWE-103]|uniref:3D-(3,5/4)-trihydroxycyclohexane-1,2-dione acylhydrolase (Decyclizing) n=1 Tax=Paenibacillus artemisiicola TaxID=1172618 RepID=A0ABS3WJF5_9BACL|nr:3D-(3,5/4)-trihydroxycyclohexane-1,2-dione acylhydrolase (decyclizing) [Paenibacillus artemisiicola]MBO7748378.1 3D-(3,5/4)-trihydroxycyclohexane-1,2-dione acylhydrolase (decyclizing) [Paenibacillus artemisiicola]